MLRPVRMPLSGLPACFQLFAVTKEPVIMMEAEEFHIGSQNRLIWIPAQINICIVQVFFWLKIL